MGVVVPLIYNNVFEGTQLKQNISSVIFFNKMEFTNKEKLQTFWFARLKYFCRFCIEWCS